LSTNTLVNHLIFKSFYVLNTQSCQPFANHLLKVLYLQSH